MSSTRRRRWTWTSRSTSSMLGRLVKAGASAAWPAQPAGRRRASRGAVQHPRPRVEKGDLPDLANFRRIVHWLGLPPDRFFQPPQVRTENTPDVIAHDSPAIPTSPLPPPTKSPALSATCTPISPRQDQWRSRSPPRRSDLPPRGLTQARRCPGGRCRTDSPTRPAASAEPAETHAKRFQDRSRTAGRSNRAQLGSGPRAHADPQTHRPSQRRDPPRRRPRRPHRTRRTQPTPTWRVLRAAISTYPTAGP